MVAWNSGSKAATIGVAGHGLAKRLDRRQVDGVVRGRGRQELPQRLDHAVVDHESAAIVRAGMDGLQRHGIDRRVAGRDRLEWRRGNRRRAPAVPCQHGLGGHLQDLVLQRRGAQVRDEEVHLIPRYSRLDALQILGGGRLERALQRRAGPKVVRGLLRLFGVAAAPTYSSPDPAGRASPASAWHSPPPAAALCAVPGRPARACSRWSTVCRSCSVPGR